MSIQKNDDSEEMSAVNYVYSCGRIGESWDLPFRTYDDKPICFWGGKHYPLTSKLRSINEHVLEEAVAKFFTQRMIVKFFS